MESPGPLPASDPGTLPGDLAAALTPLVERISALLTPPQTGSGLLSVALFDSGPGQIGSPRVAQVAVWIALARRAATAGLGFAWGVLQEPGEAPAGGTTAEDLGRLLGSRTPHEAGGEQLAAWRRRLETMPEVAEVWMIGPPRIGSPPTLPGASRLQVWDDLTPGERRVGLAVRAGSGIAAQALLDLPDEADCVRLLRLGASAAGPAPSWPASPAVEAEPADPTDLTDPTDPSDPVLPPPAAPDHDLLPEPLHHRETTGTGGRFAAAFHRLTGRTALASRFSRAVSRHHEAYLNRLMEMFESGDFDNALHHAVPLAVPAEAGPRRLPLRPLSPRAELRIRPERSRPWSSSGISPEVYGELRRLYREAFLRLEAQERIEEAAYLLAEVLHAHEEAVGFLERHGRFRLAAEMAEARELPPGLVVRQWFLAGDRERALRLARRTGAFADAVTRLERSRQPEEAHELRRLWAQELARAGDYAAAVDALWPLGTERHRALPWMDRAIEQGGPPAGRMLARKVALAPEPFGKVRDAALALLESWRAEGAAARLSFADTLRRGPRTPAAQSLARPAVRALARDSGRLGARLEPAELRQLVTFAGDAALKADAPALPLPPREPWISRPSPWRVAVAGRDAGTMPAHDAAFLPNGLTVVALGEAGVRLLSRDGRSVAELDPPAHRLVVSEHGDRALALARRGEVWRVTKIDFVSRTAEDWCDARLESFAPDFDGGLWFVAESSGLSAVDTTTGGFESVWATPLPGPAVAITRSATHCSLLVAAHEPEVWTYELPSLTLRHRETVPPGPPLRSRHLGISPEGLLVEPPAGLLPAGSRPGQPAAAGDWVAFPAHSKAGFVIHLHHRPSGGVRAEVVLERATRVTLHLTPQVLTLADDRGRVLVLDLEYGQVRRDLRL
ncbi:MAG TPA: hypothetical protein VIA62_18200 [Thermoanaerobaculia bacterium]|jgi:hypothetical protein|nr:hypothetical protein [Thermoanaerobaculia bacterium]